MHAPNPSPLNTHPILAEATRGGIVESFHRGALAIVDADGAVHTAMGDIERPIFPRSAVKVLQALPLVESGAAEKRRKANTRKSASALCGLRRSARGCARRGA